MRSGLRPELPPNLQFASHMEEGHGVFGQVLSLNGNFLYGDFAADVAVRTGLIVILIEQCEGFFNR